MRLVVSYTLFSAASADIMYKEMSDCTLYMTVVDCGSCFLRQCEATCSVNISIAVVLLYAVDY